MRKLVDTLNQMCTWTSMYFKDQGHPLTLVRGLSYWMCLNLFLLETFRPTEVLLFHREPSQNGRKKLGLNGPDYKTKMAAMPLNGEKKNLKITSYFEGVSWSSWNFICCIRYFRFTKFVQMMTVRWPTKCLSCHISPDHDHIHNNQDYICIQR